MIKTVNLQKIFKTEEVQTWALNNVNIEVKEGEFVAVMGPSGCGKSTLLNILGLLDNPSGGEYYLNGKEVSKYTEAQRTSLRKGVIGFVFQSFNLIDELNVYENIELPLLYMGIPSAERKRRVETAMERMAITHRSKHFPQQLSGGQQQRVAIARAVVANPKLILADEPTGNLDSKNGKEVMELLNELNKEGTTIVMVTHSQHDAGFAGRIINLFDGQVDLFTHSMLVVPDKQMEDFRFVMDLNPDGVSFDNELLTMGTKVKVVKGDFSGIEGEIATEANKTYVVIRITGVLIASVKVPKSYLKIIK